MGGQEDDGEDVCQEKKSQNRFVIVYDGYKIFCFKHQYALICDS